MSTAVQHPHQAQRPKPPRWRVYGTRIAIGLAVVALGGVATSHEAACDTERKQVENLTASNRDLSHALAELMQGRAGPVAVKQIYQSGGIIASGNTATGAMGEKPVRLKVPDTPFSWQKLPPCNEAAGEEAIGGGCWYAEINAPRARPRAPSMTASATARSARIPLCRSNPRATSRDKTRR